jgi:hypothetical protein
VTSGFFNHGEGHWRIEASILSEYGMGFHGFNINDIELPNSRRKLFDP